jgi:hypothetical protein
MRMNSPGQSLRSRLIAAGVIGALALSTLSVANVSAATAVRAKIIGLPASAIVGQNIPFQVEAVDALGQRDTNFGGGTALLSLAGTSPQCLLSPTIGIIFTSGLATVSNFSCSTSGTATIVASSPGLAPDSATIEITGINQPASVGFTVQPLGATQSVVPTATSGQVWGIQPQVTVLNVGGQPVTSDNATVVTLSIGSGSGTLVCTSGTSRTVIGGVASFSGCSITGAGTFRLLASATNPTVVGITPATSLPFNLGTQSTGLTLTASPVPINIGETSVLTVQLTGGANQPVQIQWKSALSPSYTTVATVTTNASGQATYTTVPLTFSTTYQAVFPGGGGLAASTSPTFVVGVRRSVTMDPLWSGYKKVNKGTKLTFHSKIGPLNGVDVPRGTFQIYKLVNGVWEFSTSATFACDSAGNATFTWTFSKSGNWYVRWRANSDNYNVTAYSPIDKVQVP